jgi:hypothetical protein
MTPQEQELIKGLFDRLSQLESQPRDPEAERVIAQGLASAPHAIYALVQTVLVQDEALRLANARIEELQAQISAAAEPEQRPASFLDSMREAFSGRAPHGSVPSVRTAGGNQPQGQQPQGQQPQPGYPQQMPLSGYPGAPGFGSGGSFLGTAASTAAGVIGGSLLLDGIRSMFGDHLGGARASAFARGDDQAAADREQDRRQDLADDDREQDRQQDLADDDREQDVEQDLADEDAQQDSEQDLTDDEDFASGDGFSDDGYDA